MHYYFAALLFLFSLTRSTAQDWQFTALADMPEPVSNNSVVAAEFNGQQYVYSFAGIDSTKSYSGIHNKCWRLDVDANVWESLPDLPDPMEKIALGANVVNGIIYIMGGYHVFANGSEVTSEKVHRFDIASNTFLTDGNPIPRPVDDHVQVVYRDSLIYLVTGWHGTINSGTNVTNVQIYNTTNDSWQIGTAVPNTNDYKVFGASGSIVDDKIYYFGGAKPTINFGISNVLRIGVIDPLDPTKITWETKTTDFVGYRTASTIVDDHIYFIGGSNVTYNYDGIAYNGSGGVPPNQSSLFVHAQLDTIFQRSPFPEMPMDLRSIGELSNSEKIIAGGMETDQKVSKKTWKLTFEPVDYVSTHDLESIDQLTVFPNPGHHYIAFNQRLKNFNRYDIYNSQGTLLQSQAIGQDENINIKNLNTGAYIIVLRQHAKIIGMGKFLKM